MELHNGVCFCCNSNRVLTSLEPEKLQEIFETIFLEEGDINLKDLKQKIILRKSFFEICPICYHKMKWMLKISDTKKKVETCFKKWRCLICQTKDDIVKIENWNHFTKISNFVSQEETAYICLDCLFYLDFRLHIKQKLLSKFRNLKQIKKGEMETMPILDSSDDELPIKPKLDLSILKQYKPLKVDRRLKKLKFINDDPKFLLQIPYVVLDLNKHFDQQRNPQTDEKDISPLISKDDTLLSKSKHSYFKIKLKIPNKKISPQSRKSHKLVKKLKVDKKNLKSEFNDSLIIKLERLNASLSALQEDNGSDVESGSSLNESTIKKPVEVDEQKEKSVESDESLVKNDQVSEGSNTKKYPSDNDFSDKEKCIEDEDVENTNKTVTDPNLYEEAMETDNTESNTKKLTEETKEDDNKSVNNISENRNSQMEVEEVEESANKINEDTPATANMIDDAEDNSEKEIVSEDENKSADLSTCDKAQETEDLEKDIVNSEDTGKDTEKEESIKEMQKKNKYKPGPKSKKKQYLEPESNNDEKSNDFENTDIIFDDKTVNNKIEESDKPADEDEVKSEADKNFEEAEEKKRRHKPGPKSKRRFKEAKDESDTVDVDRNNVSKDSEDEETNGVEKASEESDEIVNDSEKSDTIDLLSVFEEDESESLTQSTAEDDKREDVDIERKEIASDAIESEKEIEDTENDKENGSNLSISENSENVGETLKRKRSENDNLDVSVSPDKKKKRVTFSDDVFPL